MTEQRTIIGNCPKCYSTKIAQKDTLTYREILCWTPEGHPIHDSKPVKDIRNRAPNYICLDCNEGFECPVFMTSEYLR